MPRSLGNLNVIDLRSVKDYIESYQTQSPILSKLALAPNQPISNFLRRAVLHTMRLSAKDAQVSQSMFQLYCGSACHPPGHCLF